MSVAVHDCGEHMRASALPNDEPVGYPRQPIWVCDSCNAWEPRDGWRGPVAPFSGRWLVTR